MSTKKEGFMLAELPFFPGFYESMLSGAIDSAEEYDAEAYAEREIPIPRDEPPNLALTGEPEGEHEWQPEHLRISASEYAGIFFDCTDYQRTYLKVAQHWVEAFDEWCHEHLGTPEKSFVWESMQSPREYNFTTDRVFAHVPTKVVEFLFAISANQPLPHLTLAKRIKDTCTSYDGFASFYSNDLDTWLGKPLEQWDHNEIGALIAASIMASDEWSNRADFSMAIYYGTFTGNGEDEREVDWKKFDEKVAALRAKKLAEHQQQQTK